MAKEPSAGLEPLGHGAPLDYHRRMLDDAYRVAAYDRAIRTLVRPGDVVLDVGAGTGLLSMLAARRGAARVHAVESMPVGALCERLCRHNGLSDRVIVHRADLRTLAPVEPVDLVVGEFMGRFLVDDQMLEAAAAAARWLKPGGRFCPSSIRLRLAPVGGFRLRSVDLFEEALLGLDLTPAVSSALNTCYHTDLGPNALLAPSLVYRDYDPLVPVDSFDRELQFAVDRAGRLVGFAGWFEATLAPGQVLSTEPGIDTHWGQMLFPVPPGEVLEGDVLGLRLRCSREGLDLPFRWEGSLTRGGALVRRFSLDSRERLDDQLEPA